VSCVIPDLEIEEHALQPWQQPIDNLSRGKPAGIQRRMDFPLVAGREQRFQKLRLGQRFPTGKGHAAAGLIVKQLILFDFPDQFRHPHHAPHDGIQVSGRGAP
jgi:hypothetical protein